MVDYYWEYGEGFYQKTMGLDPVELKKEVLKITGGRYSAMPADYALAASRLQGYNAEKAAAEIARQAEEKAAREIEQAKLMANFQPTSISEYGKENINRIFSAEIAATPGTVQNIITEAENRINALPMASGTSTKTAVESVKNAGISMLLIPIIIVVIIIAVIRRRR